MLQSDDKLKIKPPLATSHKEVAALKAELEIELKNKKQCAYQPYECNQLTIDRYKYCLKHILQDKNAPFKQCSFVYTNSGKRCHLPAPKTDKKDIGYCTDHSVKTTLLKYRQNSKNRPPQTPEVVLTSLLQYVKKAKPKGLLLNTETTEKLPTNEDNITTITLDPFIDIDANKIYNNTCRDILELCSESDSDVEPSTLTATWPDHQFDSSDNESIDSEQEDVLKHANVYTAEEITSITREKLIKLQSLYIEQYRYLQHVLKEKKRKYIHNLKREKETCCNISTQLKDTPKEQRLYRKLKALNKYHCTNGDEALLNKRLHDLRAKITDGLPIKPQTFTKCMYTEGGVKCGDRTLPMAKHCRKHILEDPNQVLFRACGKKKIDVECSTPVEVVFEDATCRLHIDLPSIKTYNNLRKNSESDFDDSLETPDMSLLAGTSSNSICNTTNNGKNNSFFTNKVDIVDYKSDTSTIDAMSSGMFEESKMEDFDNDSEMKDDKLKEENEMECANEDTGTEITVEDIKLDTPMDT